MRQTAPASVPDRISGRAKADHADRVMPPHPAPVQRHVGHPRTREAARLVKARHALAPAQAPVATSRRVVQPPGVRQTASGSPMSGAGLGAGELSVSWRGLEESRSCSPCLGRSSEPVHRSANDLPVLIVVDCPPVWLLAHRDELDADPKPGDAGCDRIWPGERSDRGQSARCLRSSELQVRCRLLAALGDHLVRDLLAVVELTDPGGLHRADVHEHILAAILRFDEAKALRRVEPLYGADREKRAWGSGRAVGVYPFPNTGCLSAPRGGSTSADRQDDFQPEIRLSVPCRSSCRFGV